MKRKFLLPVLAFISAAGLFFGCNTDIDTNTEVDESSLTLNASVLSISDAVATVTQTTLTASLTGSTAAIKWTSSDSSIVALSNTDSEKVTLTAMGAGTARVVAKTSDGKLSASCKVTVTLGKTPAHPVTNLAVDNTATTTNSVKLTWTDSSDLTSVKIVCIRTDDNTIVSTTTVAKGVQTAEINGLLTDKDGIDYTFNVYAVLNEVTSVVSSITAVTLPDTAPPGNVTELTVSTVTDHAITITWKDPSDTDFNNVIVTSSGTMQNGSSFSNFTVNKGIQTAIIKKLAADTEYTFVVKAEDVNNNISVAPQPSVSGTTNPDITAPGTVTKINAVTGRDNVTLTWTAPADMDLKSIIISTTTTVAGAAVPSDKIIPVGTNTATITGLTPGGAYTFALTPADYNGFTGTPVTTNITTINPAPTNVAAVTKYSGQVVVTWADTTVAESGITYTYTATATPASIANGESIVTKKGIAKGTQRTVFSGLTSGTSYTFSVVTVPSDTGTYAAASAPAVTPIKILWRICNSYNLAGTGDTSYMLVPNIENSTYEVAMGKKTERSDKGITYEYWLVVPSIADTSSTTEFSLEALDADKNETGYYLYLDPSRKLPSTALQYNKWGYNSSGVTYASFVAKAADSYIKDKPAYAAFKLKSDTKTINSYTCNALEWGYDNTLTVYATYLNTFGKNGYSGTNNDYFWYIEETN